MMHGDEFEDFMRRSHSTGLIETPPDTYQQTTRTRISISRSSGHLTDATQLTDVPSSNSHGHLHRGSHPTFHIGDMSGVIPDTLLLSPEYKPRISPLAGDFQPSSSKMSRKRPSSLKVRDFSLKLWVFPCFESQPRSPDSLGSGHYLWVGGRCK